jgi:hypothetical protein
MTTTGYFVVNPAHALPTIEAAEATLTEARLFGPGAPEDWRIMAAVPPLTAEQIAALRDGHPDDREAEALRAATDAFFRVREEDYRDEYGLDGRSREDDMRDAIRAYQLAHEHPEWDAHRVVQALDATTESETR